MSAPALGKVTLVEGAVETPVRRNAVGTTAEFTAWMITEQRRIYGLCQHMLQDRDEADSATQDSFLKAHRALQKPGAEEPVELGKWLTRIAVNTCLDRLRSRRWQFWRRRPGSDDEQEILRQARSARPEAEDRYFAEQIRARLVVALQQLSTRQRAVFTLRHYENLTMEEIAQVLGLDSGTVKAHMHRAVTKLRVELRDLYGARL
ncbi:MAG: sigma-70 family RNA polymerase sigma factor [Acidobacteriota bacterium]